MTDQAATTEGAPAALPAAVGAPSPLDERRTLSNHLMAMARAVHATEMVPKSIRGQVDTVFATMMWGAELGLSPLTSLQSVYLIEGRPTLSASFMRARILAAGHHLSWVRVSDAIVQLHGRRAGEPSGLTVTWSWTDAERARLTTKEVWRKYPRAMLCARATSELARLVFPDLLHGLAYLPEELNATGEAELVDIHYGPPTFDPYDDDNAEDILDEEDWEDVDERPAHVVAAEMLDAEDAQDAEWIRQAREAPPYEPEEASDDAEDSRSDT